MIAPASLTADRVKLEDGPTAYLYEWNGAHVPVADAAGNILRVVELLRSDAGDQDKLDRLVLNLFPDPEAALAACESDPAAFGRLVSDVLREVCGVDMDGKASDPLWDEAEDAALIRISLRMAYGIDWDADRDRLSWAEFVSLVYGLPSSTPLGRAMHYRNPDNRPDSPEAAAEFDRVRSLCALGRSPEAEARAADAAMSDVARALLRKAGEDDG